MKTKSINQLDNLQTYEDYYVIYLKHKQGNKINITKSTTYQILDKVIQIINKLKIIGTCLQDKIANYDNTYKLILIETICGGVLYVCFSVCVYVVI